MAQTPKDFLIELATDPNKLGSFILNPDKALDDAGINDEEHRVGVKNGVAAEVHKRLTTTPESYTVLG